MEVLNDPEEKVICPYNPSHHIRKCRLNTHLIKCRESYPDSELLDCIFNINHKIAEPELQWHHENCPDRKKIEITTYLETATDFNKFPIINIKVPTEECWDDYNVPTYNPKKYCEKNEIICHVNVQSAAKRKNFRLFERQRINQLIANKSNSRVGVNLLPVNALPRRNLPEKSNVVVEETTPAFIENVLKRLKKNKPFVLPVNSVDLPEKSINLLENSKDLSKKLIDLSEKSEVVVEKNIPTFLQEEAKWINARRNKSFALPGKSTVVVEESTPSSVEELLERLKLGKNKSFVPIAP